MPESYRSIDLGLTRYDEAYERQRGLFGRRLSGDGENTLFVTRHEPTITMGKSARKEDLLAPRDLLEDRGIKYVSIDRGGGITYHGPGQIVLYPVFDLRDYGKDLREFVCRLGRVVQETVEYFGIEAEFRDGEDIGVWVKGTKRKLCSIGIRVKRWYSMHGLALNVDIDKDNAGLIRPCGVTGSELVSLTDLVDCDLPEVKGVLLDNFKDEFDPGGSDERKT